MAAFLLRSGESDFDVGVMDRESLLVENLLPYPTQSVMTVRPESLRDVFYHDCADATAAAAIARIDPEPIAPATTPIAVTPERFGRVRRVYVEIRHDRALGHPLQRRMCRHVPCDRDGRHGPCTIDPRSGNCRRQGWQMGTITRERAAQLQGGVFLFGGLWPILHIRSFEWVTGPKADRWLVKTVAGLLTVIAVALLGAAKERRITPELEVVATGSAAVLATIDVVYVSRRRISRVYLLDAAAQLAIIGAWLRARSSD